MGGCRVFVYLVAAATGEWGVTGDAAWSGLALGAYVVGLSFVARRESFRDRAPYWPVALLAVPILFATLLLNTAEYRTPAIYVSLILGVWILRALWLTYWTQPAKIGRTISALLAGIVFVDWLAIAPDTTQWTIAFLVLFVMSLFTQRYVPAT
jgi:hypothetical protein